MLMWIQTLVSVCVLVYSRPVTDAVGNTLTAIPRNFIEDFPPPPILLSQTRGAIYLKAGGGDSCDIWCNTTENNDVSWLYYDPETSTSTSLTNDFSGYRLQQQRGIQVHKSGNHGNIKLHVYDQLGTHEHYIQCVVSNKHGAIFGDRVHITHKVFHVAGSKRIVKHALVGSHVTLSCDHVIHMPPADHVVWEFTPAGRHAHSSELLSTDADDVICTPSKSVCTLLNVTTEKAGNYRCYFHREAGTKYVSHDLYVHISKGAPSQVRASRVDFLEQVSSPALIDVNKGDSATLQCAFVGDEVTTDIRWKFARPTTCRLCAGAIQSSRKYRMSNRAMSLTIMHVTDRDAGTYQCTLDNGRYVSTYEITIRLVEPPVLGRSVDQAVIGPGRTVTFTCSTIDGRQPTSVTWWRNLDKLPDPEQPRFILSDNGDRVTLYNATTHDTGSLTCNVSNSDGYVLGYRHVLVTENAPFLDSRDLIGQHPSAGYDVISTSASTSVAAMEAADEPDDDVTGDQNMSVTLRVSHFNILWKELRTLEQRIEVLEDRLNSCLVLNTHKSENVVPQLLADDDNEQKPTSHVWPSSPETGRPLTDGENTNDLPSAFAQHRKSAADYNIEIRFVRNSTNDVTNIGSDASDPSAFSATCSARWGCQLWSSAPLSRPEDDVSGYVEDDVIDDEDYDLGTRKHYKRRRHRSSRFKFADEKQEVTHNLEQRETYVDDRLRSIRVRYRIIQHGRTSQTKTLWAETYNIDISESGSESMTSDPGSLEMMLTFRVEKPIFWDLKTKVKVDIARDYVTGGECCLFRRDFYEWRVHYSDMDALTCHVI